MIIGTFLIKTAIVAASTLAVQQMQMERAMHAHMMEMEKFEAAEDAPGGAIIGGVIGQGAGHGLEGAAIGAAVGGAINKPAEEPQLTPEEIERQKKVARERIRQQEAELLRQQQARLQNPNAEAPKFTDYPYATHVPGKKGFVFSPYNKLAIDVRGIDSDTLVQDPHFPAGSKKLFRVP